MNKQDYLKELSLFADLDSAPKISSEGNYFVVKFCQNGLPVEIRLAKDDTAAVEVRGGGRKTYSSYRALLASANFGNIKRLADAQRALIKVEAPYIEDISNLLPIVGFFDSGENSRENSDFVDRVRNLLSTFPKEDPS